MPSATAASPWYKHLWPWIIIAILACSVNLAQTLQLRARLHLDELTGEVELNLTGYSNPNTLELNLISPTQPERDRKINLTRSDSEPGRYIGQVTDKVEGRRFVELLGVEGDKTWRLFEEEDVSHDKDLLLGDEPLQGAEDLKH
ncbi:hypothetical protein AO262_14750 [Pseudomonas fluorescens ABAC62]|nr:hypothetical protein AO262_14750 [Pseudomonas fluorescens ABAC62]